MTARAAALLLASALLLVSCGDAPEAIVGGPRTVAGVELPALPHPDLAGVEDAARRQLEERRRDTETTLSRPAVEAVEAAEAVGGLARLYHAYGLATPARAAYRAAAALAPDDPRWPYLEAVLEQREGEPPAAIAALEQALALRPGDGPALLRLGEALLDAGRPEEAGRRFQEALAAGEAYVPAARFGLGRAAAAAGDPATAVRELEAVLAARPEAGRSRYPLALSYRALGRLEEAREQLALPDRGEVTFPDPLADELAALAAGAGAHLRRGGQALTAGRLAEAEEAFRQAVAAAPDHSEARRNLAVVLLRQGRPAEAAAELTTALASDPDNVWLSFDLGNARLAQGDAEGAIEALSRALTLAPEVTSARFNLANALFHLRRWGEAEDHLETLLAAEPDHANARYLLAMAELQQGRAGEAERRLRELLAAHPEHAPARQGLAQIRERQGDLAAARRLYEEALAGELPADSAAAAHRSLGQLALRLGEASSAAGHFAAAVRLMPADPGARLGEAVALSAAGRHREAGERLEAAHRELPAEAPLTHALARFLATSPDPALRDGPRALALAEELYRAQPVLAHAETVAMALAAAGQAGRAAAWQRSLLARVEEAGDAALAARLRSDLARYERGEAIVRPLS